MRRSCAPASAFFHCSRSVGVHACMRLNALAGRTCCGCHSSCKPVHLAMHPCACHACFPAGRRARRPQHCRRLQHCHCQLRRLNHLVPHLPTRSTAISSQPPSVQRAAVCSDAPVSSFTWCISVHSSQQQAAARPLGMEEGMDHAELVAQFCGITGASAAVAEQYLDAMSSDLEKAIDFYMDHPPNDIPEPPAAGGRACMAPAAAVAPPEAAAAAARLHPCLTRACHAAPRAAVQHRQRNQTPSRWARTQQPRTLAWQQRPSEASALPASRPDKQHMGACPHAHRRSLMTMTMSLLSWRRSTPAPWRRGGMHSSSKKVRGCNSRGRSSCVSCAGSHARTGCSVAAARIHCSRCSLNLVQRCLLLLLLPAAELARLQQALQPAAAGLAVHGGQQHAMAPAVPCRMRPRATQLPATAPQPQQPLTEPCCRCLRSVALARRRRPWRCSSAGGPSAGAGAC